MLTFLLIFSSLIEREKRRLYSIQFNTSYQRDRVFYFQSLVHICIKVHLKTKVKVCHKKKNNYDLSIKSIQFSQLLIFTKLYIKFLNFKKSRLIYILGVNILSAFWNMVGLSSVCCLMLQKWLMFSIRTSNQLGDGTCSYFVLNIFYIVLNLKWLYLECASSHRIA